MSYDILFKKDGETCILPFEPPIGGKYRLYEPGTTEYEARFNITYNYGKYFAKYGIDIYHQDDNGPDIWEMERKTAAQVAAKLAEVIPKMSSERNYEYWNGIEGDAKQALINLLLIAASCPADAVCETY